ncbi:hypothetical protein [Cellulomonas soli]
MQIAGGAHDLALSAGQARHRYVEEVIGFLDTHLGVPPEGRPGRRSDGPYAGPP